VTEFYYFMSKQQSMDGAGVITNVGHLTSIHSRSCGKDLEKRSLTLVSHEVSVEVTLWGQAVSKPLALDIHPVLCFESLVLSC
jgi:hypothetical protein